MKQKKTGRRPRGEQVSPRDQTVCFMLSAEEKAAVDRLSRAMGWTRSAVLSRMAEGVLASVDGPEPDQEEGEEHFWLFLEACRDHLHADED